MKPEILYLISYTKSPCEDRNLISIDYGKSLCHSFDYGKSLYNSIDVHTKITYQIPITFFPFQNQAEFQKSIVYMYIKYSKTFYSIPPSLDRILYICCSVEFNG